MSKKTKVLGTLLAIVLVVVVALALMASHNSPCGTAPPVGAGTASMKAVVYRCYGPPEVARLEEVARPAIPDDRMLVAVKAASVNPLDWHYLRGEPYIMRMSAGFGAPKDIRLGVDFAGVVESVGAKVTHFKPGDEVFGTAAGAFGEYVAAREDRVASKPASVGFDQAAAVPVAAITALQALRDQGKLRPGQKVLVNGASGGVGTFAVQLAKVMGAEVTGVCGARNVEQTRSLGADHVIDYAREDFTRRSEHYDLIIDNVGSHTIADYRRVLTEHGTLVIVGSTTKGRWLGGLTGGLKAMVVGPFVSQKMGFFLARINHEDLDYLARLMASGKLVAVIDRSFPLKDSAEALRYLEAGHSRGKVVITIDSAH
jgi:NADPH:quinone reductase-like Zn-dependent oxidoreductase